MRSSYRAGWCEFVAVLLSIPPKVEGCKRALGTSLIVKHLQQRRSREKDRRQPNVLRAGVRLRRSMLSFYGPATTQPAAPPPTIITSTSRGGSAELVVLSPGILSVCVLQVLVGRNKKRHKGDATKAREGCWSSIPLSPCRSSDVGHRLTCGAPSGARARS